MRGARAAVDMASRPGCASAMYVMMAARAWAALERHAVPVQATGGCSGSRVLIRVFTRPVDGQDCVCDGACPRAKSVRSEREPRTRRCTPGRTRALRSNRGACRVVTRPRIIAASDFYIINHISHKKRVELHSSRPPSTHSTETRKRHVHTTTRRRARSVPAATDADLTERAVALHSLSWLLRRADGTRTRRLSRPVRSHHNRS